MASSAIVRRTSATASIGTSWTAHASDGTFDVTIDAAAGDVVELGALGLWGTAASYTYGDAATIVSGSVVNWVSTGTGSHTDGVYGWFNCSTPNDQMKMAGTTFYTVQSGDVDSGQVTFRLYSKVSGGTRTFVASSGASAGPTFWAAKCYTTPSKATVSGTLTTTLGLLTGSATVDASVGTVLAVIPNVVMDTSANVGLLDAATVVSGSAVNWFSSGTSTAAPGGVSGWRCDLADYEPLHGSALYVVQSGDIVSGQVTVRMGGASSAGTRGVNTGAFWLRAVG